jgi:RNA polymerase sigma-54 factor
MQRLSAIHTQQHSVLPQQIQLLKLYHLTTLELDQRIKEELSDNPLLSEDDSEENEESNNVADYQDEEEFSHDDVPDYSIDYSNYKAINNSQRQFKEPVDFRKNLKDQIGIHLMSKKENAIADFLIDSVNDQGLLEYDISTLVDDLSFQLDVIVEQTEVESILAKLLHIEPCGIGCRSIREFLLFQLRSMEPSDQVKNGILVLVDCFEELSQRKLKKIASRINISDEELMLVIKMIGTLKMKPVIEMNEDVADHVVYDFTVKQEGEVLTVSLARQRAPFLFINKTFNDLLKKPGKANKESSLYWKEKLSSALWFVSAIQQWETTMLRIMNEIVSFQHAYFLEGDITQLKPMILKTIAEKLGLDLSTVSRITCNKYAHTHFGTVLLKDLFTVGLASEQGKAVSSRVIQTVIKSAVDSENKKTPFTDHQLAALLVGKGFSIARRTVSKYREGMRIPVAQQRLAWG